MPLPHRWTVGVFVRCLTDLTIIMRKGSEIKWGKRLLGNLAGIDTQSLRELPGKAIIIAEDLTPSDTAELNADKVMGFATDIGGKTSHTAIIARTLEIPAVLGLKDISKKVKQGATVIVDGYRGKVFVNPTKEQVEEYIKLKRI